MMAVLERTYVVPLRREWLKVSRYKRAKKAVTAVRQFLGKHIKSENVLVGTSINKEVWKHGIRNPPSRIKLTAIKDEKGVVKAELFGVVIASPKEDKKTDVKETVKDAVVKKEVSVAPVSEAPVQKKAAPRNVQKKESPVKK